MPGDSGLKLIFLDILVLIDREPQLAKQNCKQFKKNIMPDDQSTGEKLLPLLPIVGDIASAIAQGAQNRKSRKFAREMYDKQRAHALEDWNMQNAYNSPSGQMERLKAAGLNPNLVYGNGADAQASGTVRSSGVPSAQFDAPRFHPGDAMNAYYNTKIQGATVDNLEAQNTNIAQETALKKAQELATLAGIPKTNIETKQSEFKLNMDNLLKDISLQHAQANLNKTVADTQYTLDSNERAQAQNASSLREAAERILTSRAARSKIPFEKQEIQARIRMMDKDQQLKDLDINLKEIGVQPGDNIFFRILGQLLNKTDKTPPTIKQKEVQNFKREYNSKQYQKN